MLKLNISRIIRPADPAYPDRLQDVASFQLADDPAVIAQVVAAIGDILVKHHNKPKPGGGVGAPIEYGHVMGGGPDGLINKPVNVRQPIVNGGGSPSAPIPIDVTPSGGPGEPIQYVPVMGGGQTSFTQSVNKPARMPAIGGGEFSR